MAEGELHSIQGSKITDEQRAADLRNELRPHLEEVAKVLNRARREGMICGFNVGPDANGIVRVHQIDVMKPL